MSIGIPENAVMALMIGALMIQGIAPGPQVMNEKPQLFWGLIASMWVGNLMLVVLNLPLIGMWIKLLTVPYRYLYPSILVFMAIGVYSLSNNAFDVLIMAVFGILGYICVKLECEPAPMILGFILGPLMEENLRRAMLLSRGDPFVFVSPNKPISLAFLRNWSKHMVGRGGRLIPLVACLANHEADAGYNKPRATAPPEVNGRTCASIYELHRPRVPAARASPARPTRIEPHSPHPHEIRNLRHDYRCTPSLCRLGGRGPILMAPQSVDPP